jgi:hypothetical protein
MIFTHVLFLTRFLFGYATASFELVPRAAKTRGAPKSLRLENHTKSQWNARNSSKVIYVK